MTSRMIACAALMLAGLQLPIAALAAPNPAVAAGEPGLVGTWKLVRFEDTAKDGKIERPFGEHPRGYFMYDATGHLSVNIMRNPPVPRLASGNEDVATDAEKVAAYDAYVGYFGTYRIDKEKHALVHVVEGALNAMYTDTDQLRPYRLKGDVLIIELDDAKAGTHHYRELHRVR